VDARGRGSHIEAAALPAEKCEGSIDCIAPCWNFAGPLGPPYPCLSRTPGPRPASAGMNSIPAFSRAR